MEEEAEIIEAYSDKDYGIKWNPEVHDASEAEMPDGNRMLSLTRKVRPEGS